MNIFFTNNKRRGRICLPRRNFPSEIAAVLSVKTGDRLSKPYRQWWKFTLQQKSAPCFSAGCAQNRLWIFSGKWDKFGTFCPKMACFLQFYIVATTQNQSIGFIVGNKILLSPSRPMPLRSAQNPHNCWVFETIYHSSCVLFDRPLHSKSCIKIVVVCRHIFLWKSVSAPKCQKLDKFSMKRTGTL